MTQTQFIFYFQDDKQDSMLQTKFFQVSNARFWESLAEKQWIFVRLKIERLGCLSILILKAKLLIDQFLGT